MRHYQATADVVASQEAAKREAGIHSSASKPKSPAPLKPASAKYPRANSVPGKAVFVYSPYTNKMVEVAGFSMGTLVKDPTSSGPNYFTVP